MTVHPFSSDDAERITPPDEVDTTTSDEGLSPLLDSAITAWRLGVPTVRLADRVVAEWERQPTSPVAEVMVSSQVPVPLPSHSGSGPATGRWMGRRAWAAIAAAAVLVGMGVIWLPREADRGQELATNGSSDRPSAKVEQRPTLPGSPVTPLDSEVASTDISPEGTEAPAVTEIVGDAKAAVSELTAEATSAVTDLFAVAWVDSSAARPPGRRPPSGNSGSGTGQAETKVLATEGDATWGWSVPPLGVWQTRLQPVGHAVDFLYERLGDDQPRDGTRSSVSPRMDSVSPGRTL